MNIIKYEVCMQGNNELLFEFEHIYQYKEGQQIFKELNGKIKRLVIGRITHNHLGEEPVVRLTCTPIKYE